MLDDQRLLAVLDRVHDVTEQLFLIEMDTEYARAPRELCASICQWHRANGFLDDDRRSRRRHVSAPGSPARHFVLQVNPEREKRHGGAGHPTPLRPWVHGGCFLCAPNIVDQQRGRELGWPLATEGARHLVYPSPFPLTDNHCIAVSPSHTPQGWDVGGAPRLVRDIVRLAEAMPGTIVAWNGPASGATLPCHRHFHVLARPTSGDRMYPLERATPAPKNGSVVVPGYPVAIAVARGRPDEVLAAMTPLVTRWAEAGEWATGNLMATVAPEQTQKSAPARGSEPEVVLYFVPRHATDQPESAHAIAALELLGEIVIQTEADRTRLASGGYTPEHIEETLAAAQSPACRMYLATKPTNGPR